MELMIMAAMAGGPECEAYESVPRFTGSLDAKVPGENVIFVERITETGRWYAVSQNEDGSLFAAHAHTEIGARRAAGLRALAHTRFPPASNGAQANAAKATKALNELACELAKASLVASSEDVDFAASRSRTSVMYQIGVARQTVENKADG